MVAVTDTQRLRAFLGEDLPVGGGEADTMFTDVEILDLLERNPDVERAALEGWRIKAARFSTLVDTTEGNTSRKYGQLLANAQTMIKQFSRSSGGVTEGRARVGKIVRPPALRQPWQ